MSGNFKEWLLWFTPVIVIATVVIAVRLIPEQRYTPLFTFEREAALDLAQIQFAEVEFKRKAKLDIDKDGIGEYAVIAGGDRPTLQSERHITTFVYIKEEIWRSNAYYFKVYLPPATDDAEKAFLAVAWPKEWNKEGEKWDRGVKESFYSRKAFFVNNKGIFYEASNPGGSLGNGIDNPITLGDVYGTPWDNSTIKKDIWKVVK
ncbi:hypothetical protein ACFL54_07295 [Planctomycetota bacterium]